jgi:hypothetical protein
MWKYLPLVLVALPLVAQPPQSALEIWVNEDGSQGFQLRVVFPDDETSAETAEGIARNAIPLQLAEKHWCLRGWTIGKREVLPLDRPKGTVVTFAGACKP